MEPSRRGGLVALACMIAIIALASSYWMPWYKAFDIGGREWAISLHSTVCSEENRIDQFSNIPDALYGYYYAPLVSLSHIEEVLIIAWVVSLVAYIGLLFVDEPLAFWKLSIVPAVIGASAILLFLLKEPGAAERLFQERGSSFLSGWWALVFAWVLQTIAFVGGRWWELRRNARQVLKSE